MKTARATSTANDPDPLEKLQELIRDIDIAMVTTVTPTGELRSRPMLTQDFDDGTLWFFTADDSAKAGDVAAEHGVNVSYADAKHHRFVSVTGSAAIVHDRERMRHLWNSAVKAFFPRGLDDPHLALLNVRIEYAEYWEAPSGRMVKLFSRGKSDAADDGVGGHHRVDIRRTPASG